MPQPRPGSADSFHSPQGHGPPEATAGAELFALCQSSAADGTLSPDRAARLQAWLDQTPHDAIPAWDYVQGVVRHIIKVRKVALVDIDALHCALETVLPVELRRRPVALRLVERSWESREAEGTERLRNEILASPRFVVADCKGERRGSTVSRFAKPGSPVLLVRSEVDEQNPHAIEIRAANGRPLGAVPIHHARELAPLLDEGARYRSHLASVMSGTHAPVLTVQAHLYASDAALGSQKAGDRKLKRSRRALATWALRLVIGVAIACAVAYVLRV